MVNNMLEMLADVPPMLAGAWVVWFIAGGALVMWYRRAVDLEYAPATAARPVARVKPVSRQPSGGRAPVQEMPVEEAPLDESTPHSYEPPPVAAPVVAREKKPVVLGDPFGDLATLLDQAAAAPQPAVASHRAPGDSPILSSSGSPIRRANSNEPV
jgi:hypothetical protein